MKRAKTNPAIHKPDFDVDGILRFAAQETSSDDHELHLDPKRVNLPIMLKPDVIDSLNAEAIRKGKAVNQIIEKLVKKHLAKH